MLSTQSFLALLQSFLMKRRRSGSPFPQMPLEEELFGRQRWSEVASAEDGYAVLKDMRAMLFHGDRDREAADVPAATERIASTAQSLLEEWLATSRNITFFTSGSTGTPKACTHSAQMLEQEAEFLKPYFEGRTGILSVVPAHHLYGFTFGVYLPAFCDIPVRRTIALPHVVTSALRDGDAVIGLPILWEALLRTGTKLSVTDVLAVSATAPISSSTLLGLEQAGFTIADIFGSSETGVAGIRVASDEPYRLSSYFLRADSEQLERLLPDGCRETVRLEDNVAWHGERHFLPSGRRDKAVQVGGVNVYPARVAERLRSLPEIADCAVRLMRPEEGNRLKAFIIPVREEEIPILQHSLRRRLKKLLTAEECPASFSFGSVLPRNSMNKLADW
ncbi:MAG: AMP-binding protein [Mailhella sp.]|nr:AMP-binding protein [Mailhella sp.]